MRLLLTALVAAGLVLGAACGDDDKDSSNNGGNNPQGQVTGAARPSTQAAGDGGTQTDGNAPNIPPLQGEIVSTGSGLRYIDEKVGDGASPTASSRVSVHYTGWLTDGTKFDSSRDRGAPATFALTGVIPGWTEGLQTMKTGGKRRLIVPPELGYGAQGRGSIPPNATLIFDVELLAVQ